MPFRFDLNTAEKYEEVIKLSDLKKKVEILKENDKNIYNEIADLIKSIHPGLFTKVMAKCIKLDLIRDKAFEDVTK